MINAMMTGKDRESKTDGRRSMLTRFWNSWKTDSEDHLDLLLRRRRLGSRDCDAFLKRRLPFVVLISILLLSASWLENAVGQ
jgi:hypothetical protein